MKKKTILILLVLIIVIAVGIIFDPTRVVIGFLTGEKFVGGRPTSYWRKGLEGDPKKSTAAIAELEKQGSASVPVLGELLGDRTQSSSEVRWTAAEILGKIGPDAEGAEQPLMAAAADDPDPHVRTVAAGVLPKVGVPAEKAVPLLIELLKDKQPVVVIRALSEYRADAKQALPDLITILNDKQLESETRWNAARTLGKLGPAGAPAVPALVENLQDTYETVREHSAEALGDIGPAAKDAVPALLKALKDEATKVRRDAVRSLGQIGEDARVGLEEIKALIKDPEEIVREAATNAVRAIEGGPADTAEGEAKERTEKEEKPD